MSTRRMAEIWIVGSSIISRLGAHIEVHQWDLNLGLNCSVKWYGKGSMRWEHLLPFIREKRRESCDSPDVIVIHLGGNSMGLCGKLRLMQTMKKDITEIMSLFPDTMLMFSAILPRYCWRYQTAASRYGMDRTRRWLNGMMRGFMSAVGMRSIFHRNITLLNVGVDGVHLNVEGNDLLLRNIRSALAEER